MDLWGGLKDKKVRKSQRRGPTGITQSRAVGEKGNGEQMPEIRMRILSVCSDRSQLWVSEERLSARGGHVY